MSGTAPIAAPRINNRPPRHSQGWSRTVGLLKVLLPTVAVSLVALVIVWSMVRNSESGFSLSLSLFRTEDARKLNMVNARYAGMSKNRRPYLVTASTALLDNPRADTIHLTDPKGDVTLKSGVWVALTAPKGDYHQQKQILDLRDGVNLFHDSGLQFDTPTATINLQDSSAFGHDPVTGHGPASEITSNGFRVLDEGNRVIFTGKSHLTLYPKVKTPPKPQRAGPTVSPGGSGR
ncbi:MAG: LPS export ABC transporter periplasmic protein LptC [Alphaproteobacteria bacterium]|nr:LPS export ABC transporter periplasmic protein LptC [Alphaproteobacteria bacterium]